MSEREGINENKKKFFLLTRKYIVKKSLLNALPTVGSGKVYSLWMYREAQTELAIVYTKVLNISHSIIHSFEPSTV